MRGPDPLALQRLAALSASSSRSLRIGWLVDPEDLDGGSEQPAARETWPAWPASSEVPGQQSAAGQVDRTAGAAQDGTVA